MTDPQARTPRYGTVPGVRALLDRDVDEEGHDEQDQDVPGGYADLDTAASLDDRVLLERLDTAANQVDAALAPYYPVPFDSDPPGLVVDLTQAIAGYLATLTFRQSGALDEDNPVRLRYEWALGQLDALAKGTVGLPGYERAYSTTAGHGSMLAPRNPTVGRLFGPGDFGLVTGGDRGWDVR